MAPSSRSKCPRCGFRALEGQVYCGRCGVDLVFCGACGDANLRNTRFCHACGEPIKQTHDLMGAPEQLRSIERIQICLSCHKVIGAGERFCSYCGAQTITIAREEPQALLDPRTLKVTLAMVERVTEAKNHAEYYLIDQLTTLICDVALRKDQPRDAQELSFSDQLRVLTLVFEHSRDKVVYKGETFGEHVRWPWETLKTGGDCDCKVVLLATLLASLAFRKMYFLVLPGGTYVDSKENKERRINGHALLEVELSDNERRIPLRLDPSCPDCDVDEISESIAPFLSNFYRIPIIP